MSHLAFIQKMHEALQIADMDPFTWEIRSFPAIGSTNARVADMLGLYEKVIILSETQSQGKGRQNKVWYSSQGGLWISFGLLVDIQVAELSTPLIQSVYEVVVPNVNGLEIKAPNDLLIGGKKVCGILVETIIREDKIKQIIVGIGININNELSEEVKDLATRLSDHGFSPNIHTLGAEIVIAGINALRSYMMKPSESP